MKIKYMVCGCLVTAAMSSSAMADMYSALQDVYDNNPIIARQRDAVDAARADLDLAKTELRPYVGLSGNISAARTKLSSETYDYVPKQIGVEFQQNIFQGFSTIAAIKAAKGMLASQKAVLYATEQEVLLNAINAYINVLNTAEILRLNQNNQRVLQEYHDRCVDMLTVGTLTRTDVAQASARVEMAKYAVSDAAAKYDNSIETFKRIYGHAEKEYEEIDLDRLIKLFPESVSDAEEYALRMHPSLLALIAQEAAARESITIARKSMWPSVDVRAASMQVDDLPYFDKVRDSRVGVYLKVPLYDKGNAMAHADKARMTVAGIENQTIDARRAVIENLNQAWNIYDAQTSAISAATSGVAANQMALDGIREEQRRGRRTVLDVLNAEQELLNSKVSLAQARHAKISAFFAVLASMGRLNAESIAIAAD